MQKLKINLSEVRGISDSITVTFNFVKQEFLPLITTFSVLVLPLVFIDLFLKSFLARETFTAVLDSVVMDAPFDYMARNLSMVATSVIVYLWIQIVVVSYLRVYHDKYKAGEQQQITVTDVWRVLVAHIKSSLLWSFLYVLIVFVGLLILLIPGIYLSIALFFTVYLIILRDKPMFDSVAGAMALVRGKWWDVLIYILLLQLLVGILAYVFNIPYTVVTFMKHFTGGMPGIYKLTFTMLLGNLGQSLMQVIMVVGMGVKFFGLLEEKEHITLLDKIGQIGNTGTQKLEGGEIC